MNNLLSPLYPAPSLNLSEDPSFYLVPHADAESDNVHALFRRKIHYKGAGKVIFQLAVHGRYSF